MNTELIKKKILDLAIRGKLVEQRPEEGTAEELYAQIQEEKKKLIAEGKLKKEKTLPDITDEEIPFEIPESWKWVRIGNVINEVIVPQRDKPPFSGNIPWCRIEDKEGCFLNGTKSGQYVSDETVKKMNLRVCPIGTILNACSGASIGTILITTVECCTNQTFNGLVCNKHLYNWYLFWYLKSVLPKLKSLSTGSAMGYISQDKMRNMIIPLPPLTEQKRIVNNVEEIFSRIDVIEKAKADLAKDGNLLEKKILDLAIRGKLVKQRPEEGTAEELYAQIQEEKKKLIAEGKLKKEKPLPEITEEETPFDIPDSWKWVRLAFLGTIYGGGTPKTTNAEFWGGDIAWITPADLNGCGQYIGCGKKNITLEGLQHSSAQLFPKDSIIISSRAPIGYIAIAKNEATTSQGCKTFSAYSNMLLDTKYIFYVITARVPDLITRASGTTFKEISGTGVGNTVIPLPPLAEQKRIVAKIEEVLPYCDKLK